MSRKILEILICVLFFSSCGGEKTECEADDSRPCGVFPCENYQYCNAETNTWEECPSLDDACGPCCVCVDVNGEVRPHDTWGSPDYCDGQDNDCDGTTDEGVPGDFECPCIPPGVTRLCSTDVGECTIGIQVCIASSADYRRTVWSDCVGGVEPVEEICDGLDNDCNGLVDDLIETCNGLDDDCDGATDEDYDCSLGQIGACHTSCHSMGAKVCDSSCNWGTCAPPVEICSGLDDDCDGSTDEGFNCQLGVMQSCPTWCGTTGYQTCDSSCNWGTCTLRAETCNDEDDDCDGSVDENFNCRKGSTGSCATACGTTGSQTCDNTCNWGACVPPAEICNGRDDDCDGSADEGFFCRQGVTLSCTTLCGTTGLQTCGSSCGWSACTPPAETCNARDDDCDGSADEGFFCRQGVTQSCVASCGTTGSQTCGSSCNWGTCTPPAETCNARDDDCDGSTDEDFACRQGSTGSCATPCGSTGSRICSSSCSWGACTPPSETCGNGRDDDCDGSVDEGCCTDADHDGHFARAGTCPSGDDCNDSNATVHPGATEICDGLDNDCNSSTDVIAPRTVANVTTTYEVGCTMGDGCCDSPSIGVVQTVSLDPTWFAGMARNRVTAAVEYAYYVGSCPAWSNAEIAVGTTTNVTTYRQSRIVDCTVQQPRCDSTTPWGSLSQTWTFSAGEISSSVFLDVVRDGDYGVKYRNWRVTVEVDCH